MTLNCKAFGSEVITKVRREHSYTLGELALEEHMLINNKNYISLGEHNHYRLYTQRIDKFNLDFVLLCWTGGDTSGWDESTDVDIIIRGEILSYDEVRHMWAGDDDGYLHYPDNKAISDAFEAINRVSKIMHNAWKLDHSISWASLEASGTSLC